MSDEKYSEDCDIEEEIFLIVSEVLQRFDQETKRLWLGTLEIPLAVNVAMDKLDKMVKLATCQYDGSSEQENALEVYIPDDEPIPALIDTWARGVVPLRKAAGKEYSNTDDSRATSPRGSTSSYQTSKTGTTRKSGQSRGVSRGSAQGGQGPLDDTPDLIELEDEYDEFSDLNKDSAKLLRMMQNSGNKPVLVADTMTEQDEFELIQAEVEKAAKELKGKKYIVDKDGKVIPLVPVKGERLPQFNLPMGSKVTSEEEKLAKQKATAKKKGGSNADKKKVRVAGSREVDPSYFVPTISLATSLSSIEPEVKAGVTMRIGQKTIEGPPMAEEEGEKISRKKYMNTLATRSLTANTMGSALDVPLKGTGLEEGSTTSFGTADLLAGDSYSALPMSMVMLQSKFKDIDPFEGGRKIVPAIHREEDFPLEKAADISGGVAAVLPSKPSEKQKLIIDQLGGSSKYGLKFRDPPSAQIPVLARKHLPAPAVGNVTGHGIHYTTEKKSPSASLASGSEMLSQSLGTGYAQLSPKSAASVASKSSSSGIIKQARPDISKALF